MISFTRTHDMDMVRMIISHPKIYSRVADDGMPPAEQFEPTQHEALWYILIEDEAGPLGLFLLVPHSTVMLEIHTYLLPSAWGEKAKKIAREMAEWLWSQTSCCSLITYVPRFNRLALRFAQAAGMKIKATVPKSFLKHEQLHDQILLTLSRP